jgi:hypothetical protein
MSSKEFIKNRVRQLREDGGVFIDDAHQYVMACENGYWTTAAMLNDPRERAIYTAWCMAHGIAPYFEVSRAQPGGARYCVLSGCVLSLETAMAWRLRWT